MIFPECVRRVVVCLCFRRSYLCESSRSGCVPHTAACDIIRPAQTDDDEDDDVSLSTSDKNAAQVVHTNIRTHRYRTPAGNIDKTKIHSICLCCASCVLRRGIVAFRLPYVSTVACRLSPSCRMTPAYANDSRALCVCVMFNACSLSLHKSM